MKKLVNALLFSAIVTVMIGCSGNNVKEETENKAIDITDVFTEIKNEISEDRDGEMNGLIEVDLLDENADDPIAQMLIEETGLTSENISSGYMLASAINVNADAIIIVEAKNRDQVDSVKEKLQAYLDLQHNIWEFYLPDQFTKVKNTIIETKGNYVIYITYDNPEKIKKIFTDAF